MSTTFCHLLSVEKYPLEGVVCKQAATPTYDEDGVVGQCLDRLALTPYH